MFLNIELKSFIMCDFRFTDSKILLGNQQNLMQLINSGELNMAELNNYTAKQLIEFLQKIGVTKQECRRY